MLHSKFTLWQVRILRGSFGQLVAIIIPYKNSFLSFFSTVRLLEYQRIVTLLDLVMQAATTHSIPITVLGCAWITKGTILEISFKLMGVRCFKEWKTIPA
jgi:hypothetical protein